MTTTAAPWETRVAVQMGISTRRGRHALGQSLPTCTLALILGSTLMILPNAWRTASSITIAVPFQVLRLAAGAGSWKWGRQFASTEDLGKPTAIPAQIRP